MIQRFFKLIYVAALLAVGLFLVGYPLTTINYDRIVITTYKAQCLSNNKDVVLQGMKPGEIYEFDEIVYKDNIFSDVNGTLNFYCKYYDEIQPYIAIYNNATTVAERQAANTNYFEFRLGIKSGVSPYPNLYRLVPVSEDTNYNEVLSPLIEALMIAISWFVLLQLARIAYIYIVFGEIVWHPFKHRK